MVHILLVNSITGQLTVRPAACRLGYVIRRTGETHPYSLVDECLPSPFVSLFMSFVATVTKHGCTADIALNQGG